LDLEKRAQTMMQEIAELKRQLRRACRQVRDELGDVTRQQASLSICGWIETWPVFQQSSVILAYMPMKDEVDLTRLIEHRPQKRWVLPRILLEERHRMVFHPYVSGRLIHHPFGMDEPTPDLPIVPSSEVQLALVPGLAFDRKGKRLGYGGGYFDRFLYDFSGVSLGVTFQALLLDDLPSSEHDILVGWIVTEAGFFHPTSP
jgi:5-formyltetrahydrofolate cyclo-ligase